MATNREYKDSVFTALFSERKRLLELYNAISGTSYTDENLIELNTLEDVLFYDMRNDISFTIGGKLVVLVEHQSTICENMPLRFLLYISRVYEKLVDSRAAYKRKLVKIPAPEFIVLYNGEANFPDERVMRLSDAYRAKPEAGFGSMDLEVRVVNINEGRNPGVLGRCRELGDYAAFVGKAREYRNQGMKLDKAVPAAVQYCVEYGILKEFLTKHSSEVFNMLLTEFDINVAKDVWLEEGREEGREEGIRLIVRNALGKNKSPEEIADVMGLTLAEIEAIRDSPA
jgi:hypothetical protein